MQWLEHLAQHAGVFFVSGVWQGFVLAAAVGLCLRLVPKTTAALRFAIWAGVLAVIVLLPFAAILYRDHALRTGGSSTVPMLRLDVRWSFAIAAIWIAASLFRAVDLAVHAVRLWSLRWKAVPVETGCAALLSGVRRVTLCTSDEVDRPSVIGFFAPRILIPTWLFAQLTASELEQVVLHEMEHLRRGDDWLNLLQKMALVLLPLNPIVLWVERRLCFERELACDDGVLRRTRAPRTYASCLTSLAERGLDRRTVSLALGVIGGAVRESELARRVHRILRREATLSPVQARTMKGAVMLGLLGGAVGLARCPQVVSFAAPVQAITPVVASVVSAKESRADAPVEAKRVVFREADAPHVTLLRATMPQSPVVHRPVVHKSHRLIPPVAEKTPAVRQVLTSASPQRDAARGWVMMSEWTEEMRPQMIVPVVHYNADGNTVLLPYAAVPTADGWFLIQL